MSSFARKFSFSTRKPSSEPRKVSDGLNALVGCTILTSGSVGAGVEIAASATSKFQNPPHHQEEEHFVWDDTEEQSYRLWMQKQMQTDKTEVNWTEYDNEIEYRDRLRCQTEANSSEKIAWEDVQERLFRQKYIQERKNERKKDGAPTWDEQKAEVDHRERIRQRQRQEGSRKKPIIWDDADERKCQERYRKKYSHH